MARGISVDPHYASSQEPRRGRHAREPQQIPLRGWIDILMRVKEQLARDNASLVAAGLALYALLAIFPSLTALVLLYGLFSSPQEITQQLQTFQGLLPAEGMTILQRQLSTLASQHDNTLSIGLITAVLLALWSARSGMAALMMAVNLAYKEEDQRSLVKRLLISLALTFGMVVGLMLVIALGVALPIALKFFLPLDDTATVALLVLRWGLLFLIAALGLSIVYRFAPDRRPPRWRWASWGSLLAASLWLGASLLFAFYVRRFGSSYGETYGALGGVVIMLLWLYLSAYLVILGAEINSEMERQTLKDTTTGPEKPLGKRQAYAADTVGPARGPR